MRLFKAMNFGMADLPPEMDESIAEGLLTNLEELDTLVGKTKERISAVVTSKNLTAVGQRDELGKISAEVDEQLVTLEAKRATGYTSLIASAQKALAPAKKTPTASDEVRAMEVRQYVRTMDSGNLTAFYAEALTSGNDEVVSAIDSDPLRKLKVASSETIERLKFERLAKADPVAARAFRDYSRVWTEMRSGFRFARTALKEQGLVFKSTDALAA